MGRYDTAGPKQDDGRRTLGERAQEPATLVRPDLSQHPAYRASWTRAPSFRFAIFCHGQPPARKRRSSCLAIELGECFALGGPSTVIAFHYPIMDTWHRGLCEKIHKAHGFFEHC